VRLVGGRIVGATFVDIGCGSGIHSSAATELGADVTAIDIDPSSVGTTKAILERFGLAESVDVNCSSVFDLSSNPRRFDIVYSWGVLHHTGGLSGAIDIAANLVKPGCVLVLAIYRRTRFCWWWKFEKRLYKDSPRWAQRAIKTHMSFSYGRACA